MENEQDAKIAAEIMKSKDWLQVFLLEFFQQWLWPVLIVSEQKVDNLRGIHHKLSAW